MHQNTKDFPENLTRFSPDVLLTGDIVTWKIKESGSTVEIGHRRLINLAVLWNTVLLFTCALIAFLFVRHYEDSMPNPEFANAAYYISLLVMALFAVVIPLLQIFFISFDAMKWKGVQFYVLVLDKDGQWRRHDLGSAKDRRHAERTLGKLQSYLRCETVSRHMGRVECYELCQEENK